MTEPLITTPRAATSADDLEVGQVVAWREPSSDTWDLATYRGPDEWEWTGTEVILEDPPPEPVLVPRNVYYRLAACVAEARDSAEGGPTWHDWRVAASALVNAVEEAAR
jgi:hypothetical protein